METRKVLEDTAHGYVSGSNHTETAGEVRNGPAGSELFPQDMDGNRQLAALTVLVCIPHQLNKAEGQEQACQKIKGAVLVAGNEEVGAPLLAGQFQVDLIPGGDLLDELRLEHLQPGAKADDDAAAHRVAGLLEQAVGRFGRMGGRQNIKQAIQVGFPVQRQQPVHLADIPVFFGIALVHIEDEGFQQVHLTGVPEVVALAGAVGVLDNDIHKKLRHQFLPFHFGKAVPAV